MFFVCAHVALACAEIYDFEVRLYEIAMVDGLITHESPLVEAVDFLVPECLLICNSIKLLYLLPGIVK
jgi:hypothetical protein